LLAVNETEQEKLLHKVVNRQLTVKQTEQLIEKEKKPKTTKKSIPQNVKIAVNTIKQATRMIEKSGIMLENKYEDNEEEIVITIKIKK
jgi:ParB family chromosome partitioning protein